MDTQGLQLEVPETQVTKAAAAERACAQPGCEKPSGNRRWCSMHQKRRETLAARAAGRTCSVSTCERPVVAARLMCSMHWGRLVKFGDVLEDRPPRERLDSPTCYAPGCERPRLLGTGRWCSAHRDRRRRYGKLFLEVAIPARFGELKAATVRRVIAERTSAGTDA